MQEKSIARWLLKDSVLDLTDAARLILEMQELLGTKSKELQRHELILLMRRVIQEGASKIENDEQTATLESAMWSCIEEKTAYLRPVSLRDLRYFARRILSSRNAATLQLRHATSSECRRILQEAHGNSKSAYVKARAILHSVFNYGIRREWCDSNPVSRLDKPKVQEKAIEPLTLNEVRQLKQAARESDMLLSLKLMLYGGIRPAEVARLRMDDICWNENEVIIRPCVSKTGGGRSVPLRGCSRIPDWQRIIPRNWARRWKELRKEAGFSKWTPDACRHTFASYHAAYFRNLPMLQLELGHGDLDLIRSRYVRPAISSDAKLFWENADE